MKFKKLDYLRRIQLSSIKFQFSFQALPIARLSPRKINIRQRPQSHMSPSISITRYFHSE